MGQGGMEKKIMIVDDSETIRNQVSRCLMDAGYSVVLAVDGKDGLEKAIKNPDASLFIFDYNMPIMTGMELCKKVKSIETLKQIPVLFLTTETSQDKRDEAKALGVKTWVVKPVRDENLVKLISTIA